MTVEEAWREYVMAQVTDTIPHCDSRILHGPGICEYCDTHPDWQETRREMKIAFTGENPPPGWHQCPADASRPASSQADHRRWGGNRPTSSLGFPEWPEETPASRMFYGDPEDRR